MCLKKKTFTDFNNVILCDFKIKLEVIVKEATMGGTLLLSSKFDPYWVSVDVSIWNPLGSFETSKEFLYDS